MCHEGIERRATQRRRLGALQRIADHRPITAPGRDRAGLCAGIGGATQARQPVAVDHGIGIEQDHIVPGTGGQTGIDRRGEAAIARMAQQFDRTTGGQSLQGVHQGRIRCGIVDHQYARAERPRLLHGAQARQGLVIAGVDRYDHGAGRDHRDPARGTAARPTARLPCGARPQQRAVRRAPRHARRAAQRQRPRRVIGKVGAPEAVGQGPVARWRGRARRARSGVQTQPAWAAAHEQLRPIVRIPFAADVQLRRVLPDRELRAQTGRRGATRAGAGHRPARYRRLDHPVVGARAERIAPMPVGIGADAVQDHAIDAHVPALRTRRPAK